MLKTQTARLCTRLVVVLALAVIVFGYHEQIVEASQYDDIGGCYAAFDNRVNDCTSTHTQGSSAWGECLGNAITGGPLQNGLSDCLINEVDFTMDMCPMASYAATLCTAARDNCIGLAETIEDEEEANEVLGGCLFTHFECLNQSGLYQCQ